MTLDWSRIIHRNPGLVYCSIGLVRTNSPLIGPGPLGALSERPIDKEKDAYMGIRGWDAIARRQEVFKKYGFGVPPGHEVSLTRNSEAKSGYARCAETFIYLWLQQQE